MPAQIVYEGVNGKYEGTLFGGMKFWVSQKVPTRSNIVAHIKDNGGKIVLLEKHADVLIADHVRKNAPPGSVSWKYITESVVQGKLLNITEYHIHSANVPRPVGSTKPTSTTRTPYTKLDEQILYTWVRRAGKDTSGNDIYQKLAEQYPHHSWQSWRDKWVNKMSRLPEGQLPPLLKELPPSTARPNPIMKATPAASAVSGRLKTPPRPAARRQVVEPVVEEERERPGVRVRFTDEDDKLLTEYVTERVRGGMKERGNKIYIELAEEHPHHTAQSWRDRWIRHVSPGMQALGAASATGTDLPQRKAPASRAENSSTEVPPPRRTPALRDTSAPTAEPAIKEHDPSPIVDQPRDPAPAPRARLTSTATPTANGQGMSRMQELKMMGERIRAARLIQRVWRGHRARKELQLRRARGPIAQFQARAKGFLVRMHCDMTEHRKPKDRIEHPVADQTYIKHEPLILEPELMLHEEIQATVVIQRVWRGYRVRKNLHKPRPLPRTTREREQSDTPEIKREREDTATPLTTGYVIDDAEPPMPEEPEPLFVEGDEQRTPTQKENQPDPSRAAQPTAQSITSPPTLEKQDFWRLLNEYRKLTGVKPLPWAQAGLRTVDLWDLWRCVTVQPHYPSRDWETVAEGLGFDWILEPEVPEQLRVAFEGCLLDFERNLEYLREFLRVDGEEVEEEDDDEEDYVEEEEEEGDEDGDEAEEEEGEERVEEDGEEEMEEKTGDEEEVEDYKGEDAGELAVQPSDADFTSSPPLVGLKRGRRFSGSSLLGPVRKRPRYDLTSEIPETPETRTGRFKQAIEVPEATAAGQATPSRRARVSPERPLEARVGGDASSAQSNEPDDDKEVMSPSQQLLSEIEAVSPARGSQRLPRLSSSANQALPSVEEDDDDDESSDAFESGSNLPLQKPHNHLDQRPRRTLPWLTKDKGKQPAATPLNPSTSRPAPPSTAPRLPAPQSHTPAHTNNNLTTTPSTTKPSPSGLNPTPTPKINPLPLMERFIALGYPQSLVVRAVKATTCQPANTAAVLESLVADEGIPWDIRGVWTDEEDEVLRGIGPWVDRLRGRVPGRGDRAFFKGDSSGDGGGSGVGDGVGDDRVAERWEGFWRLVGKHGGGGVFGRRRFLKDWDRV